MKYIDADRIRAEIERRMNDYNASIEKYYGKEKSIKAERNSWKWAECKWFLNLIASLQQEQRETDGDDGKFVKILVRKEFAELFQKLGNEVQAGQSSFVGAMNQQEQPSEICSKCIHYGKDDDYCYNPHGGMQSLINENGVYECTGFCEKEQEQPEVDLEKEIDSEWAKCNHIDEGMGVESAYIHIEAFDIIAHHFYELGLNARKL